MSNSEFGVSANEVMEALRNALKHDSNVKRIDGCPFTATKDRKLVFTINLPALCRDENIDPANIDWHLFSAITEVACQITRRFDMLTTHAIFRFADRTLVVMNFTALRFDAPDAPEVTEDVVEKKEDEWTMVNCRKVLAALLSYSGLTRSALKSVTTLRISNIEAKHYVCAADIQDLDSYRVIRPDLGNAVNALMEELAGVEAMTEHLFAVHGESAKKWNAKMDDYYTKQKLAKQGKSSADEKE